MGDSLPLSALKRRIAQADFGSKPLGLSDFTTGHAGLDGILQKGPMQGRLHEIYAADVEDAPSSVGFTTMLALRVRGGPLAWLRTEAAERAMGRLYMPGLVELGGDPASVILALLPDDRTLLRTAADAAACAGLGTLVVECWGRAPLLTLTASRRLALAVETSGVTLFLLRIGAEPVPSAATTRWRIAAAPSTALSANAPGHSMIDVELLRQRMGPAGMRWRMEWDRDERAFREPALSGAMATLAEHRAAEPWWGDALRSA